MLCDYFIQQAGDTPRYVGQRLAIGEVHSVWTRIPGRCQLGIARGEFRFGQTGARAEIDIQQAGMGDYVKFACLRYGSGSLERALQGAGVDRHRPPGGGNTFSQRRRLKQPGLIQRHLYLAAKALFSIPRRLAMAD
jgi:hypothetical protein